MSWCDLHRKDDACEKKINVPCPSCATFRAKLDREKLAKMLYLHDPLIGTPTLEDLRESDKEYDEHDADHYYQLADAIVSYMKEG